MSDWNRTTNEVPFEGLQPEVVIAIKNRVGKNNLGSILSEALMCVQTVSEKIKRGLFGGIETTYVSVVLTPLWLVWAIYGTKAQTAVPSAQLRDIVVQDYAQTQFAKMIPDVGIEVSGRFTDATENVSAF